MKTKMKQYLFRQNAASIADLRYGRVRLRVRHNGCGLVAIYNIMQRLGKPQPFADVLRDAQKLHLPWLFGLFGTKPSAPAKYFRQKGVPFTRVKSGAAFRAKLPDADAAILCTWCDKRTDGIHFFTVLNDGGRLTALNRYAADTPTPFSAKEVREDRFVCGYLFYQ